MKKVFTIAAIALFTLSIGAQTKPETTKTASCCSKTMSADEIAKCQAKCKAEGKVCTAEKSNSKKNEKKCCAKKA